MIRGYFVSRKIGRKSDFRGPTGPRRNAVGQGAQIYDIMILCMTLCMLGVSLTHKNRPNGPQGTPACTESKPTHLEATGVAPSTSFGNT